MRDPSWDDLPIQVFCPTGQAHFWQSEIQFGFYVAAGETSGPRRALGDGLQILIACGKGRRNPAANARRIELEPEAPGQVAAGMLDEAAAESTTARWSNERTAAFAPAQIDLLVPRVPANLDPAFGTGQGTVLRRVGGKLVQCQRESQRLGRQDHQRRAGERELADRERRNGARHEISEVGARPGPRGQEIMGAGQGKQTRIDRLARRLDVDCPPKRLIDDRLHRGKRFLTR